MDRLRVDLQLSSTLLRDALLEAGSPLAEERRRELADVRHRLETDLGQYVTGLPGQEREPFRFRQGRDFLVLRFLGYAAKDLYQAQIQLMPSFL